MIQVWEHLGIPVTCIIQKAAKMAVECSEILMDMVNGGGSESRIIRVMPDIIVSPDDVGLTGARIYWQTRHKERRRYNV